MSPGVEVTRVVLKQRRRQHAAIVEQEGVLEEPTVFTVGAVTVRTRCPSAWHVDRAVSRASGKVPENEAVASLLALREEAEQCEQEVVAAKKEWVEKDSWAESLEDEAADARGEADEAEDAWQAAIGELAGLKDQIRALEVQLHG